MSLSLTACSDLAHSCFTLSWAAFGYGLNATLLGRPVDPNDGGMKAALSSAVQNYANEVAKDEINHVRVFLCSNQCPLSCHAYCCSNCLPAHARLPAA